jgi:hypothetical protein
MRWAGHVACMGRGNVHTYKVFVGKPEGKIPLGRPSEMFEDNIIIITSSRSGIGEWTGLIWLRIGAGDGFYEWGKEPLRFI